jgi:hypothetical protein
MIVRPTFLALWFPPFASGAETVFNLDRATELALLEVH